jgi:hypothetical protein
MTITPHGDRFCFWVSSADDSEPYLVDMLANGGRGACTCRDWQCRCSPAIKDGAKAIPYGSLNRTTCKHLTAALTYLGMSVVAHAAGKPRESIFQAYALPRP